MREARKFGKTVEGAGLGRRIDLRAVPLVTIDGEDARDFDDAVFAEPTRGGWRLLVAIADVSHYVRPGTALDDEARESIGHAVNLGLDVAYAAVGATALAASYSGVDHPLRWRATGVAVGAQAIYLLGVDLYGLRQSSRFHGTLLDGLRPDVAFAPTASGVAIAAGVSGRF